jgi:hypothetical protein
MSLVAGGQPGLIVATVRDDGALLRAAVTPAGLPG